MDKFTHNHLDNFAYDVVHEDEREGFVAYVTALDDEDLAYWMENGWRGALNAFQSQNAPVPAPTTKWKYAR